MESGVPTPLVYIHPVLLVESASRGLPWDGVRVNCILPGLVYGSMTAPRMDEEIRRKRREASALGTEGTGWDVGWAAVFLGSDESRWITGVALPVDADSLVMSPTMHVRLAQQKF